jgi:hypothetical protein
MNQYTERKIPSLLKKTKDNQQTNFKMINGMVEFTIGSETVVLPTAEAFQRLLKKVAVLEQRLASVDNKANRAARTSKNG